MVKVEIIDNKLNIEIEQPFIMAVKESSGVDGTITLAEVRDVLRKEPYVAQMLEDLICDELE